MADMDSSAPIVSVVSPVYGGEGTVGRLIDEVRALLEPLTGGAFEIVLVEDASPDSSWRVIRAAAASDRRVKAIRLSRNFGQHAAITAGLAHARGQFVAVMDCDLQDDPADLGALLAAGRSGHDVVFGRRTKRAHSGFKNLTARAWAVVVNKLAGREMADPGIGTFSLLSRRAVDAFLAIGDVHRHYVMVVRWLGFPAAEVEVNHRPRVAGSSSYSVARLLRHAVDGVVSQSSRLLYAGVAIGFVFLVVALAGSTAIVVRYFLGGFREGWASLAVLNLLSTSVVLMTLGVLGLYVGKIFDQVRGRPLWVVREAINLEHRQSES